MELLRSIRDNEIKLPVKVRSMIIFAATIRYINQKSSYDLKKNQQSFMKIDIIAEKLKYYLYCCQIWDSAIQLYTHI